jgi:hypothetical protein
MKKVVIDQVCSSDGGDECIQNVGEEKSWKEPTWKIDEGMGA